MRYAMLITRVEGDAPDVDHDAAEMMAIHAWFERWGPAGKIAYEGADLDAARTARTIRLGADGAPVVTDGPYLELKEVIGGGVLLQAESLDEAVAIASTWPCSSSTSLEVRPIIEH